MTLIETFVRHEATMQLRSTRFRVMGALYVIACSAPAAVVFVMARRATYIIGSHTYASLLDLVQPFATLLFAGLISIDAVTRERDEGSFAVVAMAPLSSTGYLLRRWLAVMAMTLPLTLLPCVIVAALAAAQTHQLPMFEAFAANWLLGVVPVLVISSGLAIALGTINGNAILAVIAGVFVLTAGLDFVNTLLAHAHRRFDGGAELTTPNLQMLMELEWSIRGRYVPQLPTDAGYPLAMHLRGFLPPAALLLGVGAMLIGVATMYLRRTRRDLRPWKVRDDHPLRSFIKVANRIRDEYSPDGTVGVFERLALVAGVAVFAAALLLLNARTTLFEKLGAEKYAAYTNRDPLPMAPEVVPASARVRGSLDRGGRVRANVALTLRNDGVAPQSHLSFALNPLIAIQSIRANIGAAHLTRKWQRVGIDLQPPLAAGESRTIALALDGTPGNVVIPIPWAGGWRTKWRRYTTATESIELTDISRSVTIHYADETRVALGSGDLIPTPRYSPWFIDPESDTFTRETIEPSTAIDLRIEQPYGAAADSCGHLAVRGGALESRCTMSLASYRIAGGPLASTVIAPGVTLAYIRAHEALARVHGPALAAGVARAEGAWPGLALQRPIVYLENPSSGPRVGGWAGWRAMQEIGGSGNLQLIPENLFNHYQPLDGGTAAASLVINSLRTRRPVIASEADFFTRFYEIVVARRITNANASRAVFPATGPQVMVARTPILGPYENTRTRYILAGLESRVGADHLVDGVNDFVAAGPRAGTARELIDALGRRAGVDLENYYDDFIAGDKAPRLTMEDVTFRRIASGWEVRGVLHNAGSGEAVCPIALRTAAGSQWQTLRATTGERVPFAFTATAMPHSLQLDPDRVCYREAFIGATESVEYRGES